MSSIWSFFGVDEFIKRLYGRARNNESQHDFKYNYFLSDLFKTEIESNQREKIFGGVLELEDLAKIVKKYEEDSVTKNGQRYDLNFLRYWESKPLKLRAERLCATIIGKKVKHQNYFLTNILLL